MELIQRQKFVEDIDRIQRAINATESPYLRRDYQKALKRKYRLLRQFDADHKKISNEHGC